VVSGSFTSDGTGSYNLFDPTAAAASMNLYSVPAEAGNVGSANNVIITDTAEPEFATTYFPLECFNSTPSIQLTSAGLITYQVQFNDGPCKQGMFYTNPAITLESTAFSGCSIMEVFSNFGAQGNAQVVPGTLAGPAGLNTVTGSLQGSTLSLTANWLSYLPDIRYPNDKPLLTASWQLEDCPSVRPLGSRVGV
jgi:hypothetical protein